MSTAPGVNQIPEAELASPSCDDRRATSITPQLGDVVPAPQETSAHPLHFASKRPLTPTAVRAWDSLHSVKGRQLIGRHFRFDLTDALSFRAEHSVVTERRFSSNGGSVDELETALVAPELLE